LGKVISTNRKEFSNKKAASFETAFCDIKKMNN